MSKKLTKLEKANISIKELLEKIQVNKNLSKVRINARDQSIKRLKERIESKDEKLKSFRTKSIYLDLMNEIDQKEIEIKSLKTTIIKKQEKGCFECNTEKRLVKFSNLSICLDCIRDYETKHFKGI